MNAEIINYNLCVLVPTYNNEKHIDSVIKDILQYTKNLIIVNDGSTDNTPQIISKYNITIINHNKNKGKGVALHSGFLKAKKMKFTHAMVIDGDGQHHASYISTFEQLSRKNPNGIIVGQRILKTDHVPWISKFGRSFSNFWVKLETGIYIPDTHCGQRLYPIKEMLKLKTSSHRYEYELELLVKASWKELPIISVPVKVDYNPQGERISHYKYGYDNFLMTLSNARFLFGRGIHLFVGLFRRKNKDGK